MLKTLTGEAIYTVHEQNVAMYDQYIAHVLEVEEVWKAEYDVPSAIVDPDVEIANPAQAKALIGKMMKMVGIRAETHSEVVRYSNSDQERKIADKLERFCQAYKNELYKVTNVDVFRRALWLFLMRGRVGMHTIYQECASHPKVRVKIYDPTTYFPVYGDDGIEFFTREYYKYRWELAAFFQSLSDETIKDGDISLPDWANLDAEEFDTTEEVKVIEYWDKDKMGWCVEDTLVQTVDLDYGMLTLREARLGDTPLNDKRWECEPFIGAVISQIKLDAALTSKIANAIEAYFFPYVMFVDKKDRLISLPSNEVGVGGIPVHADTDVKVVNATSNIQEIKALRDVLKSDIDKSTITETGWNTNVGDESGFRYNLSLEQVKDDISDVRDQVQRMFGSVMGDVLYLHKLFAPTGGWEYTMLEPSGRHLVQKVTEEDIGVHQEVIVTIKAAVPQDVVQMVTIYNNLAAPDPVTGLPEIPTETRMRMSGLDGVIGDMTRFKEEKERQMLFAMDEEAKQIQLEALKAKYSGELDDMKKQVDSMEKKKQRKEQRRVEREIEEGISEDVVVPAEILMDPAKLQQLGQLIASGNLPRHALEIVLQGAPLGFPGEEAQQFDPNNLSPETMEIMQQMGVEMPNGLTGYEGMDPSVMPPQMQGAMPRQALDRDQVAIEAMEQDIDRAALPPPS